MTAAQIAHLVDHYFVVAGQIVVDYFAHHFVDFRHLGCFALLVVSLVPQVKLC